MFQESEIVQLLVGLAALPVLWFGRVPRRRPGFGLLYAAAAALLASWVLTLVEGVVLPEFMNQLEHFCHAVAGVLAAAACWRWARNDGGGDPR